MFPSHSAVENKRNGAVAQRFGRKRAGLAGGLRAVLFILAIQREKANVHYGLDFYEKGQEHAYAPWYLKFNGLTVHTVCSYYMVYQYKLSRTRERHLEEWYPYRDRFARDSLRNHLALALICLVVFPFVCYEQDLQIGFWLSIVGFFLWLVKSIYGLTVISRRLK